MCTHLSSSSSLCLISVCFAVQFSPVSQSFSLSHLMFCLSCLCNKYHPHPQSASESCIWVHLSLSLHIAAPDNSCICQHISHLKHHQMDVNFFFFKSPTIVFLWVFRHRKAWGLPQFQCQPQMATPRTAVFGICLSYLICSFFSS